MQYNTNFLLKLVIGKGKRYDNDLFKLSMFGWLYIAMLIIFVCTIYRRWYHRFEARFIQISKDLKPKSFELQ